MDVFGFGPYFNVPAQPEAFHNYHDFPAHPAHNCPPYITCQVQTPPPPASRQTASDLSHMRCAHQASVPTTPVTY